MADEASEMVLSGKAITMCIIVLAILVIGNIVFSIFSYFSLRDKQFEPCEEGQYRNTRSPT